MKGSNKLTKAIEIDPFENVCLHGLSKVKGHDKCVNTITENPEKAYSKSVVTVLSYTCLKPGSAKVAISLQNLSSKVVTLMLKTVVAKIAAANVVPSMLAPKCNNEANNEELAHSHLSGHHNSSKRAACQNDLR